MLPVAVFSHKQTDCFHPQRFALAPHRYSKLKSRVNKASRRAGQDLRSVVCEKSIPNFPAESRRGRRRTGLTQDRHPETRRRSQQPQGQSPQLPKTGQPYATMLHAAMPVPPLWSKIV
jgi:hypothetical protein